MNLNLVSGCHKCKVKIFHFRYQENWTMMPFYKKHYDCMRENPANVETLEDQVQEKDWMSDYPDDELNNLNINGTEKQRA